MASLAAIRTDDRLSRFLYASMALHGALVVAMVVATFFVRRGESWGGPGGSVTVGIVGSVPAIPLPRPEVATSSRVVDESKGLYKSEPKAKPEPDATPIPKFERNKPPKYVTRPSKILENPTPPPPNAVPYGAGGTPSIPITTFALGATGTTQAGLGFGAPGSGDFGARFSWYVEAVQRRVSSNWLQSTVDPSIAYAPRVIVTFTILRNGSVTNIQIARSSNNYSVDNSAIRAVRDSSPLDRLPAAYAGSEVNVEFWFDFHR
ncbi:MAG TPA: TonB family protein [Candidatus Polarisedimenticolia bacterium]|nr:TonB family protein [Candidatus Polarisedimenticolia bacterium]